jgi:3'(2'), 5'-bisphosphate nucleotidase
MHQPRLSTLTGLAISAALSAGREILDVYGGHFEVELKQDDSPLTIADQRAHSVIVKQLSETGLPVLSEEGDAIPVHERQAWQLYWLVDPLDGTREFIKRNGEFTVNIALMRRDGLPQGPMGTASPVAGVLYSPVKDLLYFAWEGAGAYRQEGAATISAADAYERAGMSARLPSVQEEREAYTIVASRSHQSPETRAFIERMEQEHSSVRITSMGSALKICMVAEGAADVYPRYSPTMEWDTAAGHAICLEAGRQVIDMTTREPMRYNKSDLMNNPFIVQ